MTLILQPSPHFVINSFLKTEMFALFMFFKGQHSCTMSVHLWRNICLEETGVLALDRKKLHNQYQHWNLEFTRNSQKTAIYKMKDYNRNLNKNTVVGMFAPHGIPNLYFSHRNDDHDTTLHYYVYCCNWLQSQKIN